MSGESCLLSSASMPRIQLQDSEPSSAQLERKRLVDTHTYRDSQLATRGQLARVRGVKGQARALSFCLQGSG